MIRTPDLLDLLGDSVRIPLAGIEFDIATTECKIRVGDRWYYFDTRGDMVRVESVEGFMLPFGAIAEKDRVVARDYYTKNAQQLDDLMLALATIRAIEGLSCRAPAPMKCVITGLNIVKGDYITEWDRPKGWALSAWACVRPGSDKWGVGWWQDNPDWTVDNLEFVDRMRVLLREKGQIG